ncbi:MAG: hypothetical protein N2Z81_06080 [Hydrogenothermaceae bacterium]|nr:hypothetical protein [Hydrogenothermaceae bacterium]
MKVAIISFDLKYVEDLKKKLENIEIVTYGDTVSFLKDIENTKPELIIYDTTSGIFAEDDLKYLLMKGVIEDGKIFGLISPENPIDIAQFFGKVKFFHKFDQINDLILELNMVKPTEVSLPVEELIKEPTNLNFEEKIEEISHSEELSDLEFLTKNPDIQEELIEYNDIATQDITVAETPFEIEFNEIPQQETAVNIPSSLELEFNDLSLQSEDLGLKIEEEKAQSTEIVEFEQIPEMESLTQMESINEIDISPSLEEDLKLTQELEVLEQLVTPTIKPVEESIEETKESPLIEERNTTTLKDLMSSKKEELPLEKLTTGGENMIANFNIQISDEEIKNLALHMARDFLEKDPAMEKIVDHLQIDFQEETRKELEDLKLELREKLRQEAEKLMSEEIERLIKEELKEYVAEITARIVKEKMDQIFKTS